METILWASYAKEMIPKLTMQTIVTSRGYEALRLRRQNCRLGRAYAKPSITKSQVFDALRSAGFKAKGFGSNEHWDNGDVIVCISPDHTAQWITGISPRLELSFNQLINKLKSI